jgi:hypothetical protein
MLAFKDNTPGSMVRSSGGAGGNAHDMPHIAIIGIDNRQQLMYKLS